ncbi:MAG: glycoside hydrolase family 3 protein [Rickettsiales bacterium]|nr:MAG: glycoside hydrolase family 3 protein [Rickettsiales bacterium]
MQDFYHNDNFMDSMCYNNQIEGLMNLDDLDINEIDLSKKIGDMLIFGFLGYDIYSDENKDFLEDLRLGLIGGVILFARNIGSSEQLKHTIKDIVDINNDIFIYVDQEGGKVQRLRYNQYPSAEEMVDSYSKNEVEVFYENMAKELESYRINVNLGPVVDIDNKDCPVIGGLRRSYSNDPEIISNYASIFIDSHHKHQIYTCIKHFPGHGSAQGDSHHGLTDVTDHFDERELIAFYKLIKNDKVDMIMTAHIVNKKYDENDPATLSKNTITNLLRDAKYNGDVIKYDGIVISDDLCMGAIMQHYSLKDSILKSMYSYFARHNVDKKSKDFGNEKNPSKGYIAWLLWGGDVCEDWIKKIYQKIN